MESFYRFMFCYAISKVVEHSLLQLITKRSTELLALTVGSWGAGELRRAAVGRPGALKPESVRCRGETFSSEGVATIFPRPSKRA